MKTTTNATKTTPGPWRVSERATEVETADGTLVCTLPGTAFTVQLEQERAATARLISLAPTLLAALHAVAALAEELLAEPSGGKGLEARATRKACASMFREKVQAAIAAAEGRTP